MGCSGLGGWSQDGELKQGSATGQLPRSYHLSEVLLVGSIKSKEAVSWGLQEVTHGKGNGSGQGCVEISG